MYTVKELSDLAKVTIKTLHYYHKIGLLLPCEVSEAGYRLYGMKELERLQQILFYRELDFPLKKIKQILDDEPDRLSILFEQRQLIAARKERLEELMITLDQSIAHARKGEAMDQQEMFKGFNSEKEWENALLEQREYLKEKYNYDVLEENTIDVKDMNESAIEAKHFMDNMASALREGIRFDDKKVQQLILHHLDFLTHHGHKTDASIFAEQARFFLKDDFHRTMLEQQQKGLSYYLCIAAEALSTGNVNK